MKTTLTLIGGVILAVLAAMFIGWVNNLMFSL